MKKQLILTGRGRSYYAAAAAVAWCEVVSDAERAAGRKEWRYVFIKESQIDEAMAFRVAIAKFVETERRK